MQILDNISSVVRDDLKETIHKGSKVSIAAACFSIYAFQELKKQLESVDELRFIFTSPTFIQEKTPKKSREFYIPRLTRERSLYGTEFEIKLRNELTQKAIARECADWIRKKVQFRSNISGETMPAGFMNVDNTTYMPMNGFTTVDLGCDRGNNVYYTVTRTEEYENGRHFLNLFDQVWSDSDKLEDVTEVVINNIMTAYAENSPDFIYFFTLYNIFNEFLEDISEDVLPNEAVGFKDSKIWNLLYHFQKDAVLAIINKLERYNGCILADSVGLGKTFTALSVIKYYEMRNKSVLVLCPKKLSENWNTYKGNYVNNPIADDRLRYDVLFHTDLSRDYGKSNGIDLQLLNWGNYDLVVIDESHNFRNGIGTHSNTVENRYMRLMDRVIRAGVKTKVLMLSATPVNNRFYDLRNQLALAYEGDSASLDDVLDTSKPIDEIFRNAQKAFNAWSKLDASERTTNALQQMLDYDFFELLDSVTIARSRKHIEKYYNSAEVGTFPARMKPLSLRPKLTDKENAVNYNQIYEILIGLHLTIYTPSNYIQESKLDKYKALTKNKGENLTQRGREMGIRRLMSINLLKRLESSVSSFRLTLSRIQDHINGTIQVIEDYKSGVRLLDLTEIADNTDFDDDDQNTDFFAVGKKVQIDLADMDYVTWLHELKEDAGQLSRLMQMVQDITPEYDKKLQELLRLIKEKIESPINGDNKKIIIFTAFSDTADYLYENVSAYVMKAFGLHTAEITGSVEGRTTIPKIKPKADLNTILTCFSPVSKGRDFIPEIAQQDIDVLIATDCISEGQNLQDCDYLINYDIHWNPVRIIQRFGRIDRIGSKNDRIQLVNFWPDLDLDEYINLKARVETRMKITVMTSTGDDDLINAEEKGDLEYRKAQLKRLQEEVVDIEDMSSGISIMDLGLNEFRLDLLEHMKHHSDVENAPHGLHAVTFSSEDAPSGVIFILRNVNNSVNIDNQNRIHPFYMVYIADNGEIVCDYLNPKHMLDTIRLICRGKEKPIEKAYLKFNERTNDGKDMKQVSKLLGDAIASIISVKDESDIDSLFSGGGTSALVNTVSGLDDFELICFLVIED